MTESAASFEVYSFAQLGVEALYEALRLRSLVFVVEQNCVFLDLDNNDAKALHLLGRQDGKLVAYARLFAPGDSYAESAIGRVVSHPDARKTGAGRALMTRAIAECQTRWPGPIRIGAQRYLEKFYGSLGFVPTGDPYMEDGIPHIEMLCSPLHTPT